MLLYEQSTALQVYSNTLKTERLIVCYFFFLRFFYDELFVFPVLNM